MAKDDYTTMLIQAKAAHELACWAEACAPQDENSEDQAIWTCMRLAMAASDFYIGQALKRNITLREEGGQYAKAQLAMDFVDDGPPTQETMRQAVATFLDSTEELVEFGAEPEPDEGKAVRPAVDPNDAEAVRALWQEADPDRELPPVEIIGYYDGPDDKRPAGESPVHGWDGRDRQGVVRWAQGVLALLNPPAPEAVVVDYGDPLPDEVDVPTDAEPIVTDEQEAAEEPALSEPEPVAEPEPEPTATEPPPNPAVEPEPEIVFEDIPLDADARRVIRAMVRGFKPGRPGEGKAPPAAVIAKLADAGIEIEEKTESVGEKGEQLVFVQPVDRDAFLARAAELGFEIEVEMDAREEAAA